ncbi:unnamed protein product [Adineta steineri]|uniref:Kinase n=1 Tax=Adineta steineri TaxID=433720 RepID=A0A814NFN4_9BILA|nr:unnamed protein product [Adineta steineri]
MHASSVNNVLFHTAIQLSVPGVTTTMGSIPSKLHSYSDIEYLSLTKKIRCNLSSFSKHSHLNNKQRKKDVRDIVTQTNTHKNQQHSTHSDDNNKQEMTTAITSTSKGYLSPSQYYQYPISSTKHNNNKSIKNTLLGIWQGLNNDELHSSPIDSKYIEEHVKKNTPNWKACSKVVTSLLTFTRTKKEKYEWIQLVGHPGTFKEGIHDGYVLKQLNENERICCELLQNDNLKNFVPKYNGTIEDDEGKFFIEMEDLLASFHEPCIMDCKIGVRTYLEEELEKSERNPEPRADLYNKMIAINPLAPTEKENQEKKILKPRYMIWRESLSSSQDLGFRIEAIKKSRGLMSKEFQRIKERNDVKKQLIDFIDNSLPRAAGYYERLVELRSTCINSDFFQTHELISSSLLFVHDGNKASLWMIDFGKTRLLPKDISITHRKPWVRGSHEDGYLLGLDNLITLFHEIIHEITFS